MAYLIVLATNEEAAVLLVNRIASLGQNQHDGMDHGGDYNVLQ